MSIWTNLTKTVKTVFGKSTLNINKVFDTLTDKMDDWKFTDQERATYNKQAADAMAAFVKDTLNEGTDRSKARRQIAILYMYWFLLFATVTLIFGVLGYLDRVKVILEIADSLYLPIAFISVIGFFFGGYYFNIYKKGKQ